MKLRHLFSSALLAMPMMAMAQGWTPTPNDTLQSVKVLENGNVVYSIYAPKAQEVTLAGDIVPWGMKPEARRQPNGVWTMEIPNVKPGAYRYHFVVDGMNVYDPKAHATTDLAAVAVVAPQGNEFFAYRKDIRHGALAVRTYESKVIGETRSMCVWTPAGYENSTENLPVLYLIHGGGDTYTAWPTVGMAGNILDNLLAEGKIQPMIVVMPDGTVGHDVANEVAPFAADMAEDIMPFVESNYRVLKDKDHTAIAGLSMGGMETMETAFQNIDKFSYVWVLSSSFMPGQEPLAEAKRLKVDENVQRINSSFKKLIFTQGGPADIAYKNCQNTRRVLDQLGVKYDYEENAQDGHSWLAWRADLYNLLQRIFK